MLPAKGRSTRKPLDQQTLKPLGEGQEHEVPETNGEDGGTVGLEGGEDFEGEKTEGEEEAGDLSSESELDSEEDDDETYMDEDDKQQRQVDKKEKVSKMNLHC